MNYLDRINQKIVSRQQAFRKAQQLNNAGKKLVFSNGCFDILHHGHIEYLAKAAGFGDVLMIGLNTDDSVKRLKGKDRPLNPENSRAILLAALQFVDYVVLFDEDTPYKLIKAVQPDVLVKGKDYKAEEVVGYDIVAAKGGEVKTVEFVEGFSSSDIMERMKRP
ncbi:MAG: D-glycero-beta-D-manno-heptose 1-phosphate adenylyltransferase [Bacteroidales bacterium]